MKILYIMSDKITVSDIVWGLVELGEEVEIYGRNITLQKYVEEEQKELESFLSKKNYRAVVTFNFSPMVSNACQKEKVKYISWVFDSPQIDLYTKEFHNKCNYIFVFDKRQKERLKERNPEHLYYMPLGANVAQASFLEICKEDREMYGCDISFIGGLYEKNAWNSFGDKMPQDIMEKMENWLEKKLFYWKKGNEIFGCLSGRDMQRISEVCYLGEWVELDMAYYMENQFLTRKAAEIERICLLNLLAEHYSVELYTGSSTKQLKNVRCHEEVNDSKTVEKIYYLSKINLNITLRSIETGIPKRIFDVMSVGGFVISNYQEELEELFVPDEEIVLFHTPEELLKKVDYYLRHEEERNRIAQKGYLKVKECYTYPVLLKKMLEITESGEEYGEEGCIDWELQE